ncbi:hypothetical protein Tco_1406258 [Tanacetum coccineum]
MLKVHLGKGSLHLWKRGKFSTLEYVVTFQALFMEKPVEIMDREVKRLKQSRIPIVKVRWNSKRGPEFTWELEDQFQKQHRYVVSSLMDTAYRLSEQYLEISSFKLQNACLLA